MAVNVEIKARARDWDLQLKIGLALANSTERLSQFDTFFTCANGLLKLRRQQQGGNYLVFYRRTKRKGPKSSDYTLVPVADAAKTTRRLASLLGVTKIVRKRRLVCHYGRTRIHFDEVKGLGRFIELEVVLRKGEATRFGQREAALLMRKLGIQKSDLLAGSYADMPVPRPPQKKTARGISRAAIYPFQK